MAGFLVATALCLRAGPEPVRYWALVALWLVALIAALASRRRAAYVTLVLLGLLVVADHVAVIGGSGAVRRELDTARGGLARVRVAVQGIEKTALLEVPLSPGGWAALDTVIAREGGSGVVLLVGGAPLAWSGDVPDGWSPLPKGVWVIGTRTRTHLAEMAVAGPLTFLVSYPVKLASRADTAVVLDQNPFPLHLFAPEDPGSSTEWIYAALMLVLVLEILERRGNNHPWLALSLIGAGRLSLALSKPQGTLFGSDLFATSIPLLQSPGDLFATGIAFLLLASLLRRREADDAQRVPRVVATALGSLAAASALGHLWRMATPFCNIPLSPLELIATRPEIWAMIGASSAVFAAFVLLVAWAPPTILGLGSIVWLAAGSGVPAGWVRAVPLLAFSVFLVRQRHLWTVVQSTGVVLAACCLLLPHGERLVAAVHRVEVERLAARLSFDERPWFRFLAREALGPCVTSGICLDEVWRRGPLGRFPATGQLLELNQSGQVVDRLTFGLRHRPAFEPATAGGVAQWEDVTEEIPPPRVVVNASAACAGHTVVVSLVADLLAPVSAGGAGFLADGTPWPGAVRFADRGLLSLQKPEGPTMGWRRESAGEVFRFQRELADGPHVADLALLRSNLPARTASFLAVAGMLCLTAAGALGLGRLWMVSSRHELFYRYRDRLLPLLLLVGTGPVVSLLAIAPSLERAAQDRDRRLETASKCRDVADSFRLEALRQARELAPHVSRTQQEQSEAWEEQRIVVFDREGIPLRPLPTDESPPTPLVRVSAASGRTLLWVTGQRPLVHALVPHAGGAMLLKTPVDAALSAALGGTHDWSAAVWRQGRSIASVLSAQASPVQDLLPRRIMKALSGTAAPIQEGSWAFSYVPDDLLDETLVVGVRLDRSTRLASQWATIEIWALGIFLPLVTLTVLVSSLSARWVSTPISRLTTAASAATDDQRWPRWPRLTGELGNLSQALGDMTERLEASGAAVTTEKAHLETILEHIAAWVIVVNQHLVIERTNSAVRPSLSWLATDAAQQCLAGGPLEDIVRRVVETGTAARMTLTRQGDRRTWQVSAAPLGTRVNAPVGAVVVLEETTELLERQRLLTWAEFAREAAHEIKNPLTPIKLSAQHLKRAFMDHSAGFADILAQATEMIERQTDRMETILRELSSFSRATGRSMQPVDLCTLVEQCVRDYSYYAGKGIAVRAACTEPGLEVLGDAEALRTVCGNLIDNAVRAVGSGGVVTVGVLSGADMVILRCDDTGPGIPPEMFERVFESGFSLRPGGTGLGLAICRSLVTVHGGSIRIANLDPRGARVDVRLPRHVSAAQSGDR